MYRVQLNQFEGPLDLLLFFIRRDELDIYDIPVAQITDEFLGYVRLLEQVDLDGAAEFIYMAAVLISIKARVLLPRQELDEDGEPIDPRAELVERLLEYIRYKEASTHLSIEAEIDAAAATVAIDNMVGRLVVQLRPNIVNGRMAIVWDLSSGDSRVSSGVYRGVVTSDRKLEGTFSFTVI